MNRVAQEFCGTDTLVYPEPRKVYPEPRRAYPACPDLQGEPRRVRTLGFSSSRHLSPELEGAPPLMSKGGLFRSDATALPLSPLGSLFHESRFTSHESLTLGAHP